MMTREEASTHLFDDWYIENGRLCVDESNRNDFCKALGVGIKALRPVSREQVEKVWRGEWMFPIFGDQQDANDPRCQCSECGSIETPLARHRFCPSCGAPMTDEAVQMVMERLEAIR